MSTAVPDVKRACASVVASPACTGELRRRGEAVLKSWGLERRVDVDAVKLVITEMATNALQHGGAESIHLVVEYGKDSKAVRLEVRGGRPGKPVLLPQDLNRGHGRGMQLIAELSKGWGTAGNGIWCTLPVPSAYDWAAIEGSMRTYDRPRIVEAISYAQQPDVLREDLSSRWAVREVLHGALRTLLPHARAGCAKLAPEVPATDEARQFLDLVRDVSPCAALTDHELLDAVQRLLGLANLASRGCASNGSRRLKRAVVYAYAEGLKQAQRNLCRLVDHALGYGYAVTGAFLDRHPAGFLPDVPAPDRRGGRQLAALIELGGADVLIVRSAGDLGSSSADLAEVRRWLSSHGVELLVVEPAATEVDAWLRLWSSPNLAPLRSEAMS